MFLEWLSFFFISIQCHNENMPENRHISSGTQKVIVLSIKLEIYEKVPMVNSETRTTDGGLSFNVRNK